MATGPARLLLVALVGLGVLVRGVGYVHNASLWGDEAMLALNLGARTWRELARPLDYAQVAPIPFLWAERMAIALGGVNEYVLRLLPFLAGLVLVLVFAETARRLLPPAEALVASGLLATAFPLIRYSVEIKPYAADALISLWLTWSALRLLRHPRSRSAWRTMLVAGALGVVLSIPAIFVATAVAVAIGLECVRGRAAWWRLISTGSLWAVLWVCSYIAWYRETAGSRYMQDFWQATFLLPGTDDWWRHAGWGVREAMCSLNCWRGLADLTPWYAALLVLGAVVLRRRLGLAGVVLLVGPLTLTFLASMLGRYPLATRLLLFTAPQLVLLVAVGLVAAAGWVERRFAWLRARWLLTGFLLPSVVLTFVFALDPPNDSGFSKEELRPLIADVVGRAGPGDAVYIYHRATPAWIYYTTRWRAPDRLRLAWAARVAGPDGPGFVNGASRGVRELPDTGLARESDGMLELLGAFSGSQGRQWQRYVPASPDPGWAEVEVSRMRDAGRPHVWILFADFRHDAQDDRATLLGAVRRAGGRASWERRSADAAAYRVEFADGDRAR